MKKSLQSLNYSHWMMWRALRCRALSCVTPNVMLALPWCGKRHRTALHPMWCEWNSTPRKFNSFERKTWYFGEHSRSNIYTEGRIKKWENRHLFVKSGVSYWPLDSVFLRLCFRTCPHNLITFIESRSSNVQLSIQQRKSERKVSQHWQCSYNTTIQYSFQT